MATLEIDGRDIEIDDAFLKLTPDEQRRTVDEITNSPAFNAAPPRGGAQPGRGMDPGHANVPEFVPIGKDGQPLPGYNRSTGMMNPPDMGAIGTAAASMPEGVPIVGPLLDKAMMAGSAGIGSMISGDPYSQVRGEMQGMVDHSREQHPVARFTGNVAGAGAVLGPIGATRTGGLALGLRGPSLLSRTMAAGGTNAAIGGADTLARGGNLADAGKSALLSGGIGAVLPSAGRALSQVGSKAAQKAAPTIDALRQTGNHLYGAARASGITLKPGAYKGSLHNLSLNLRSFGYDPGLHPKTTAVLQRLAQATRGPALDLQELDILRKLATNAVQGTDDASDQAAARLVIKTIDDLVDKPGAWGIPANRLGQAGGKEALGQLKAARAHWHTMKKAETIDELFYRARIKAGADKGQAFAQKLRAEFKSLLLRPGGLEGFSRAERRALERAAKGGKLERTLNFIGKRISGLTASGIGGFAGFASGGPLAAGATIAAQQAAGHAFTGAGARLGVNAAQKLAAGIRSGAGRPVPNYAGNIASPLEQRLRLGLPMLPNGGGQ